MLDVTYDIWQKIEVTKEKTVLIKRQPARLRFPELERYDDDYRQTGLGFLKEYGAIKSFVKNGDDYAVTFERRVFDRAYQTILTRAVQDGYAHYKGNPLQTKALAEESRRRQQATQHKEVKPIANKNNIKSSQDKVTFDNKTSTLTFGQKECPIPDESLEHYVCKLTFSNRRAAAKEQDILDAAGMGQDSQRAVYDAYYRVNEKAKSQLSIPKLLAFKAAKVRIDKRYQ